MTPDDLRVPLLLNWLKSDLSLIINEFSPASSDASFRRYFRIHTPGHTYVVMDAPPDKENIKPFMQVAGLLHSAGVKVPAIYNHDLEQGFLLLEDFGSTCFLDILNNSNADSLYLNACNSLYQLQTQGISADLPRYDHAFLARELAIFEDWFLEQYLGLVIPEQVKTSLHETVINSALEQPVCFVHRDFHSRNLMLIDPKTVGVIDFQDAVLGPVTYDLVSLFRDCYIKWPQPVIEQWLNIYFERLRLAGFISCSRQQFIRWFDLMGLQRHLKAIGIFSRLKLRDQKSDYIKDIPRTLDYVLTISAQYPELETLAEFLHRCVLPTYENLK